jgi:hypothetical protein
MVWLNGSVLHDPPVKTYECRVCHLTVVRQPDGEYDIKQLEEKSDQTISS